ncbi:MAG: pyruvate formate lyase activating enzyme [Methanothermococcus sp.]|uniref:glycyl-radical enzyme activating protein n=1 Tax=Methanothermococcus sp. TaxID=2614238 RepID=UPI002586BD91|nr:glycyl-radical enzyme activating protein [Methanothermococcus sp.]MDK2791074.1 pyruvate formate lyase activating enzyme [Methanothermococcus sp.]
MKLLVTNIQRFSLNDGPGIRTTIFLKGCSIKCPWCCNPETQSPYTEIFFNRKLCLRGKSINCERCLVDVSSPEDYLKVREGKNIAKYKKFNELCPTGALGIYGSELSLEELITILKKDEVYFKNTGGGVTFSGGEPLLRDLSYWLKKLKSLYYHICIETSLYAPFDNLRKSINFVDLYIVDVKILSHEKAREILKGDIGVFFRNVEFLVKLRQNGILFRFPIVNGYTNTEENIRLLFHFIRRFDVKYLEIFSVHNLAMNKYLSLGREYKEFPTAKKEDLEDLKRQIERETFCKVNILEM